MSIELVLEEIPKGVYGKALGSLRRISTLGVELIELKMADSWKKEHSRNTGKLLAEKQRQTWSAAIP
ncbi:hypothetical protein CSA56_10910 [candidate division KSB3 bacterium]|uniref:Uncharacterized protein n=1 Tax=candidate division KSB3 bacterium TaxID=2044937 RepID=A0A2G6KD69_9BACT|nr:MAG: hypothetical protein CSA56_10910 [candidate division KSB3 bacterium]